MTRPRPLKRGDRVLVRVLHEGGHVVTVDTQIEAVDRENDLYRLGAGVLWPECWVDRSSLRALPRKVRR